MTFAIRLHIQRNEREVSTNMNSKQYMILKCELGKLVIVCQCLAVFSVIS